MSLNCNLLVPFNPLKRTIAPSVKKLVSFLWKDRDEAELEQLAARNTEINLAVKAAKAASALEAEQPKSVSAIDFIRDHKHDKHPDSYPEWWMLEDLWAEIVELPFSGLVIKELLSAVERFRQEYGLIGKLNPHLDVLWVKLYGMINKVAAAVDAELEAWDNGEPVSDKEMKWFRPANIYRRYGLALRYAVETLGSFQAKQALNALMLSVTLPVDELENPEWVDSYTGESDPEYEFIRVREQVAEVSSDGNLPATLADLMDNLGEEGRQSFEDQLRLLGMTSGDYWRQFIEAQRSGVTMAPEPEEMTFDDDTDSIEKDFEFKADLMVDPSAVDIIKSEVAAELRRVKELINLTASEIAGAREVEQNFSQLQTLIGEAEPDLARIADGQIAHKLQSLIWRVELEIELIQNRMEREFPDGHEDLDGKLKALPFRYPVDIKKTSLGYTRDLVVKKVKAIFGVTWDIARARFFSDGYVRSLIRTFSDWAVREQYEPKDLMAVLLPYQNAFGFREDEDDAKMGSWDLVHFRIPQKWGGNLHVFMQDHGEVFLEQFITGGGAGIVASSDPDGDALEHWTNDLVADRQRSYLSKNGAKIWRLVYNAHTPDPKLKDVSPAEQKRRVADQWFDWVYQRERQAELEKIKRIGMKPNQRNNREFVEAEVQAALMGDGGSDGPQQAGWDAYRNKIDPDANREFKRVFSELRKWGVAVREANKKAMEAFWARVARNKSRIDHPTKNGLVLRSGRVIDWGIAKLKFEKDEIPTDLAELQRLQKYLETNRFAPWFLPFLKKLIADFEFKSPCRVLRFTETGAVLHDGKAVGWDNLKRRIEGGGLKINMVEMSAVIRHAAGKPGAEELVKRLQQYIETGVELERETGHDLHTPFGNVPQ